MKPDFIPTTKRLRASETWCPILFTWQLERRK